MTFDYLIIAALGVILCPYTLIFVWDLSHKT